GEGARIEVQLARSGDDCVITVADDGPGVAPTLRSQLSARFVRGEVEEEGCGLGLSIVARIAALSHAKFELGDGLPRADGGHGLAATLRFSSTRNQA
ncbi:MAG: two-component sensor histidine kinase, partial [Burkholderiaceae bacterium]|nr:two-component sensor histidine kinase [Burkholderiaceae bacterium]